MSASVGSSWKYDLNLTRSASSVEEDTQEIWREGREGGEETGGEVSR